MRRCVGRRLRIGLRVPYGVALTKATVRVNRRRAKTFHGRNLGSRPIVLRRLPSVRIRVTVRVVASDGRTFAVSRRYRRCR